MKKALCVGINDYPGTSNDLKGCVNDAADWGALLREYGYTVETLVDARGTRDNILAGLADLVSQAGPDDVVVFTYSGHGTSVYDADGDEGDGYDEALYVYDGVLKDDELRTVIAGLNPEASLIVISDSCYSGTVTRVLSQGAPRYMPSGRALAGPVRQRVLYPEAGMNEILISGCNDSEYSYDALLNGRWNGAMTRYAIDTITANRTASYNEFHTALRQLLPSQAYPQTPQLEGNEGQKTSRLFEAFEPASDEEPQPDPEPEPDEPGGLAWYWWLVIVAVVAAILYLIFGR
ncbi:MAG: caspase family protein [Candidatus Zhuqueibacterota bacterium]